MGAVKDYIVNWEHTPGQSPCGDCDHVYCGFCDAVCPKCSGFTVKREGELYTRVYGQSGEDYIAWQLLKNENPATSMFLDVGALDGARFSNTLLFEHYGWRGICIEAHPDFLEILKRNRPGSECLHCAAGHEDNDDFEFHANFLGTLSTIEPSLEDEFRLRYPTVFDGFEVIPVPMRRVDAILEERLVKPGDLSFVSVDVEGGELKVLKGFDLKHWRLRLVLIEAFNYDYDAQLREIFSAAGYTYARTIANNLFFCLFQKDAAVIAAVQPPRRIGHTRNPLHKRCDGVRPE